MVEPSERVLARNLLAKDDARAALADETEEGGPEVAFVLETTASAGVAEWLAGAGSGPDWAIVGPAGAAQGVAPDSDAGEEVALVESHKVDWRHVNDAAFIDFPGAMCPAAMRFRSHCAACGSISL
jgi:hypothetical protein